MPDVLEATVTPTLPAPARIRTWTPVHTGGYQADRVEFDLDLGEHKRRQAAGLGAFPEFRAIETLMNLPGGWRIDYRGLPDVVRKDVRWLEQRYPGVLEVERVGRNRTHVTNLASPPVRDCLALVYGKRFTLGHMDRASRFAPMGRRGVVYPPGVAEKADPFAVAQYGFYGVGVGEHDGDGVRWLLDPEPYRPMRFTAAAWSFAESIYGQWLEHCGGEL